MSDESPKEGLGDLLGIKPISKAIETVTDATVKGAGEFLSRICLPAAEEFGLLLQDRVRAWRFKNVVVVTASAQEMLGGPSAIGYLQAHPRIVNEVLDAASWCEDEDVQEMWAGLLASSCMEGEATDENLLFVRILSQLSGPQARVLNHACESATKAWLRSGLVMAELLSVSLEELRTITQTEDLERLDRELDDLRERGLIGSGFGGGFHVEPELTADITPTPLALYLFVRAQGSRKTLAEFFDLRDKPQGEDEEALDEDN